MANVKGTTEAVKNVAAKTVEEAKEAVKTVAKVVEAKAEEVKAEAEAKTAEKVEEPVAEAVETEEKVEEKAEDEKAVSAKEEEKKTVKRGRRAAKEAKAVAAKKTAAEPKVYVQFGADESDVDSIVEKIKAEYVDQGHRVSSIKDLRVYLKPEDGAAYYVINEKVAGRVDLF